MTSNNGIIDGSNHKKFDIDKYIDKFGDNNIKNNFMCRLAVREVLSTSPTLPRR